MVELIIVALGIIGALVHLRVSKKPRSASRVLGIFLTWALLVLGVNGVLAFIAHVFFGPATARFIGWPPGNPFQFEVGIANLSLGVLGLMSVWRRGGDFWLATIVMATVFYWGAAVGHIIQIVRFQNFAPGNAGLPLYADIIFPLVLIGLYAGYMLTRRREQAQWREQAGRKAA
jgi:hypothetical protein